VIMVGGNSRDVKSEKVNWLKWLVASCRNSIRLRLRRTLVHSGILFRISWNVRR